MFIVPVAIAQTSSIPYDLVVHRQPGSTTGGESFSPIIRAVDSNGNQKKSKLKKNYNFKKTSKCTPKLYHHNVTQLRKYTQCKSVTKIMYSKMQIYRCVQNRVFLPLS